MSGTLIATPAKRGPRVSLETDLAPRKELRRSLNRADALSAHFHPAVVALAEAETQAQQDTNECLSAKVNKLAPKEHKTFLPAIFRGLVAEGRIRVSPEEGLRCKTDGYAGRCGWTLFWAILYDPPRLTGC